MNHWCRIIAHVDMDAFFASVEQRDFPELKGKPVGITNGELGSCLITRSYEARRFGIKTGMRLYEARQLCPHLIQQPSRPHIYAQISTDIMQALELLTPDMEIFSVDEAFLEFSHCRRLYHSVEQISQLIQQTVFQVAGITCSVGISGDKTTAKFASKQNKPNGILIIPPSQARARLASVPVINICGIAKGISRFLAQYGVYFCGDMQRIPMQVLAKRFGNIGRRLWLMCQGLDPEPLNKDIKEPKSIGHGKVMPPNTSDKATILFYLSHMAEKVGQRLRKHNMYAQSFYVGIRLANEWLGIKSRATMPTHDGKLIYAMARELIEIHWQGKGVFQCQITALNPQAGGIQKDLFANLDSKRETVNQVIDSINQKFGKNTVTNGSRLQRLAMPDVIAPAWRPSGHRENIG